MPAASPRATPAEPQRGSAGQQQQQEHTQAVTWQPPLPSLENSLLCTESSLSLERAFALASSGHAAADRPAQMVPAAAIGGSNPRSSGGLLGSGTSGGDERDGGLCQQPLPPPPPQPAADFFAAAYVAAAVAAASCLPSHPGPASSSRGAVPAAWAAPPRMLAVSVNTMDGKEAGSRQQTWEPLSAAAAPPPAPQQMRATPPSPQQAGSPLSTPSRGTVAAGAPAAAGLPLSFGSPAGMLGGLGSPLSSLRSPTLGGLGSPLACIGSPLAAPPVGGRGGGAKQRGGASLCDLVRLDAGRAPAGSPGPEQLHLRAATAFRRLPCFLPAAANLSVSATCFMYCPVLQDTMYSRLLSQDLDPYQDGSARAPTGVPTAAGAGASTATCTATALPPQPPPLPLALAGQSALAPVVPLPHLTMLATPRITTAAAPGEHQSPAAGGASPLPRVAAPATAQLLPAVPTPAVAASPLAAAAQAVAWPQFLLPQVALLHPNGQLFIPNLQPFTFLLPQQPQAPHQQLSPPPAPPLLTPQRQQQQEGQLKRRPDQEREQHQAAEKEAAVAAEEAEVERPAKQGRVLRPSKDQQASAATQTKPENTPLPSLKRKKQQKQQGKPPLPPKRQWPASAKPTTAAAAPAAAAAADGSGSGASSSRTAAWSAGGSRSTSPSMRKRCVSVACLCCLPASLPSSGMVWDGVRDAPRITTLLSSCTLHAAPASPPTVAPPRRCCLRQPPPQPPHRLPQQPRPQQQQQRRRRRRRLPPTLRCLQGPVPAWARALSAECSCFPTARHRRLPSRLM